MEKSTLRIVLSALLLVAGVLRLIMYLSQTEPMDIVAMQQNTYRLHYPWFMPSKSKKTGKPMG